MRACASSELYVTREYAHWRSPLPMHVIGSPAHGADQRDANTAGHRRGGADADRRPRRAQASARSICTRSRTPAISARSCARWRGSGISAACSAPAASILHNRKVVRASMGAIFHVPVEIDVPLDVVARALRAHRLPGSGRATALRRRNFGSSTATCSATRRAACRASSCRRSARRPFTIAGTGAIESLNVAADGEHVPVRAEPSMRRLASQVFR